MVCAEYKLLYSLHCDINSLEFMQINIYLETVECKFKLLLLSVEVTYLKSAKNKWV